MLKCKRNGYSKGEITNLISIKIYSIYKWVIFQCTELMELLAFSMFLMKEGLMIIKLNKFWAQLVGTFLYDTNKNIFS